MKTRFAFTGFQPLHLWNLVTRAADHPDNEIVAMGEEDAARFSKLTGDPRVRHTDYRTTRVWAAGVPVESIFLNPSQRLLNLANCAGLRVDVSGFSPHSQGRPLPICWRLMR